MASLHRLIPGLQTAANYDLVQSKDFTVARHTENPNKRTGRAAWVIPFNVKMPRDRLLSTSLVLLKFPIHDGNVNT